LQFGAPSQNAQGIRALRVNFEAAKHTIREENMIHRKDEGSGRHEDIEIA
jgi:hypothetical protein